MLKIKQDILKLALLIVISPDKKVLLMKRGSTIDFAGYFALPGGKIEINELPEIAAQREAGEELGIQIELKNIDLLFQQDYSYGTKNYLNYFYLVREFIGIIINKEPNICEKLEFFSLKCTPSPIVPFVKPCLKKLRHMHQI